MFKWLIPLSSTSSPMCCNPHDQHFSICYKHHTFYSPDIHRQVSLVSTSLLISSLSIHAAIISFHRDHTDELLLVNCLRLLLSSAEMDLIWNSNSVKFENQYYKEFKFNSKLISTQSNQPLTQIYDQQDHVMASISCREPKATSLNIKANVS